MKRRRQTIVSNNGRTNLLWTTGSSPGLSSDDKRKHLVLDSTVTTKRNTRYSMQPWRGTVIKEKKTHTEPGKTLSIERTVISMSRVVRIPECSEDLRDFSRM